MRRTLALLCLLPLAASAAPLPPALEALQSSLAKARTAHQQAQEKAREQAERQTTATRELTTITAALLRAQRTPEAVTTLHALGNGQISAPGLLMATRHQRQRQLEALRTRLERYLALHQESERRLAQLEELQTSFSGAQGKLSKLETAALRSAALEAANLAAALSTPPGNLPAEAAGVNPALPQTIRLPVLGRIISGFRQSGSNRPDGLTFRATSGAPVTSVGEGQVLYSGPFKNFGGLVIVQAGPGVHIVYANLADLTVNAGTPVQPGQVLGHLGTGPEATLYFEVRKKGRPADPQTLFPS